VIRRLEFIAITILWLGSHGNPAFGQEPPPTILTIGVENVVACQGDISDPSKFGTSPGVTPSNGISAFVMVALAVPFADNREHLPNGFEFGGGRIGRLDRRPELAVLFFEAQKGSVVNAE